MTPSVAAPGDTNLSDATDPDNSFHVESTLLENYKINGTSGSGGFRHVHHVRLNKGPT